MQELPCEVTVLKFKDFAKVSAKEPQPEERVCSTERCLQSGLDLDTSYPDHRYLNEVYFRIEKCSSMKCGAVSSSMVDLIKMLLVASEQE